MAGLSGLSGLSGSSGLMGGTFAGKMLGLPGLLAWWPQTEAAGAVADNAEGTAARDAAYFSTLTLQGATFPNGDLVASYASLGRLRFGTASLASAWNWNQCWTILWALSDATEQADANSHGWQWINSGAGKTKLNIYKSATAYYVIVDHRPDSVAANRLYWDDYVASPNYTMLVTQIDQANNVGYVWRNGVLASTSTPINASTDPNLDISNADYNDLAYGFAAAGAFPHFAVGAGAVLATVTVNSLYESIYPNALDLFACGDSKATNNDYWIGKLAGNLEYSSGTEVWRERPYRVGLSGQKVADLHTYLDANLATMIGNPSKVAIIVGANDLSGGTAEAAFKADLTGAIDALRARWPDADIYVAQPWRQGFNAEAANMKTWVLAVIATYGSNVFAGPDETTWLENGDDGVTYTLDGTHYNTAGHLECANQWQAAMGY